MDKEIKLVSEWRKETIRRIDEERHQLLSIFDNICEPVYVATMDTHRILYVNNAVTDLLGAQVGDLCYEVLQHNCEQCDFCSNKYLKEIGDEYTWEFKNRRNGRWYKCMDRAIRWTDGSIVKMELAVDITEIKEATLEMEESLHILQTAIHMITYAI